MSAHPLGLNGTERNGRTMGPTASRKHGGAMDKVDRVGPRETKRSLTEGLRRALAAQKSPFAEAEMRVLNPAAFGDDRVRLCGCGVVARLPKPSRQGRSGAEILAHLVACFERADPSGHVPHLRAVLSPSEALPQGALIFEEITGRPVRLPADLTALALTLAHLHRLTVPAPDARAPLRADDDPFAVLVREVRTQARFLPQAGLGAESRAAIDQELRQLGEEATRSGRPPVRLISFDAHPGNFVIRGDGTAALVELENMRYSYPPLDLAHATLYTSTTWDVANYAELRVDRIAGFYRDWAMGFGRDAHVYRDWLLPLRRAMWLWSVTWCARWQVLSQLRPSESTDADGWSPGRGAGSLVAHVRDRAAHYLAPNIIGRVRKEFAVLKDLLT